MSTILTPPPVTPPASVPPPTGPRSSARVVAIVAICLGALLIVFTAASAAFSAVRAASVHTETLTADVAGVTGLDVDVSAGDLRIVYADVTEATLSVHGGGGAASWQLGRDEEDLTVRTDRPWWGGGWRLFGTIDEATLTLPDRFSDAGLDASFDLSAGSITAAGAFGELDLDLSAGFIDVSGSAAELDATVAAGRASVDLAGVRTAQIELSAGSVEGRLTGTAPDELTAQIDAGRLDLRLPDGDYAVTSDVSAGSFDHSLNVDPASSHRVWVGLSAGSATLRGEG